MFELTINFCDDLTKRKIEYKNMFFGGSNVWDHGRISKDSQHTAEKWADIFFDNFVPSSNNHQEHELQDDLLFLVRKTLRPGYTVGTKEVLIVLKRS